MDLGDTLKPWPGHLVLVWERRKVYLLPVLSPGWTPLDICYSPVSSPASCCFWLGSRSRLSGWTPDLHFFLSMPVSGPCYCHPAQPIHFEFCGIGGLCLNCWRQCLCWGHPWLPAHHPSCNRPTLAVPWQPALHGQYLCKNLWCYHALNVLALQVNPCYVLPPCPDATKKWNCCQDWWEQKPGDALWCQQWWGWVLPNHLACAYNNPCCLMYVHSRTTTLCIIIS